MTAARLILVDGYNAIRTTPALAGRESESLEAGREALIAALRGSTRLANDTVIVVFDGANDRSFVSVSRSAHVAMQFTPPGVTADQVIVRRAQAEARARPVIVVTNDSAIRLACEAAGCVVTRPENLLEQTALPGRARRWDRAVSERTELPQPGPKKGNPRRAPKRHRRGPSDYRF